MQDKAARQGLRLETPMYHGSPNVSLKSKFQPLSPGNPLKTIAFSCRTKTLLIQQNSDIQYNKN